MNFLVIISIVVWIYMLSVFRRGRLDFFEYIWGSVGIFVFMMILIQPIVTRPLTQLVTSASGVIGKLTGLFEAYRDYSIIFITNKATNSSISLYVDYECSGIIEMMAFVALLAFFKVYDKGQRVIVGIVGCIGIFISNIIRIITICVMVKIWGNSVYYLAHTVVGRLVFYALAVALYYVVFTHSQVIKQKIGGFSYAEHNENSI